MSGCCSGRTSAGSPSPRSSTTPAGRSMARASGNSRSPPSACWPPASAGFSIAANGNGARPASGPMSAPAHRVPGTKRRPRGAGAPSGHGRQRSAARLPPTALCGCHAAEDGGQVIGDVLALLGAVEQHRFEHVDDLRVDVVQFGNHRPLVAGGARIGDEGVCLVGQRVEIDIPLEETGHGGPPVLIVAGMFGLGWSHCHATLQVRPSGLDNDNLYGFVGNDYLYGNNG